MIDFSSLQKRVYELGAKGGLPSSYLRVYNASPQNGAPHIEMLHERYDWVVTERGEELFRSSTSDLDELLFWVLDGAASAYSFDYELGHRVVGQDFRKIAFAKREQVMRSIDPIWGDRARKLIDEVLKTFPFEN